MSMLGPVFLLGFSLLAVFPGGGAEAMQDRPPVDIAEHETVDTATFAMG